PLKHFMLDQTRESDIATFVRISGGKGFDKPEDVPLRILVPAFATSELKSAFQIGFLIFIAFVIIALVVARALISGGYNHPGGHTRSDADGQSDALAGAVLPAVQADAVRAGGRLESGDGHV